MTLVVDPVPTPPGLKPVTFFVGPNGEAIYLAVGESDLNEPFGTEVQPGWAEFPRTLAQHSY